MKSELYSKSWTKKLSRNKHDVYVDKTDYALNHSKHTQLHTDS